jgi:conjugal transfer pilin signal peptidase TrbI
MYFYLKSQKHRILMLCVALSSLLIICMGSSPLPFESPYRLGINTTHSLPNHLFLIHRGEKVTRGDYVCFEWQGAAPDSSTHPPQAPHSTHSSDSPQSPQSPYSPYPASTRFIKIVKGLEGDQVTQSQREFFVNGVSQGHAKEKDRLGQKLALGPTGVIPTGALYVWAPHPDSLDSRYQLAGWIQHSQIIGRAYVIF